MIITPSRSFPPVLKTISAPPSPSGEIIPGLLADVRPIFDKNPEFYKDIVAKSFATHRSMTPFLVVKPEQVPDIFDDKILKAVKTAAGEILKGVHPHLKTGIDALWLVYSATKLYKNLNKPDRDAGALLFEAAGFTVDAISLAGSVNSDYKLSEEWSYGLKFILKSGNALYQGKDIPINELILSKDKQNAIPLAIASAAGLAFDPKISYVSAVPLSLPKTKSGNPGNGETTFK